MKVALTGHRPQRLGLPEDIEDDAWEPIETWILKQLVGLYKVSKNNGEDLTGYCGMASGCDIHFGYILSVIRSIEDNVKLTCVLPCKAYNASHPFYNYLESESDEWIELADEFYKGCDNARDQYMVDHCDVLLAVWDGIKSGGVWSTIRKAQKAGKQIIYCPTEILKREQKDYQNEK